jgi:hypothetical protein
MGVEGRRAVGADDPEILKAVVVGSPVDVVKDQCHPPAVPRLALSTELAASLLDPFIEETELQMVPGIGGIANEDLVERTRDIGVSQHFSTYGIRVEVAR